VQDCREPETFLNLGFARLCAMPSLCSSTLPAFLERAQLHCLHIRIQSGFLKHHHCLVRLPRWWMSVLRNSTPTVYVTRDPGLQTIKTHAYNW